MCTILPEGMRLCMGVGFLCSWLPSKIALLLTCPKFFSHCSAKFPVLPKFYCFSACLF